MKSFKHFKEDSDSNDKESESVSKLKSRKELAKQKSLDNLEKFKERSAEVDKDTESEVEAAAEKRSNDAKVAKAKKERHIERTKQQREKLGSAAYNLVKKGVKRTMGRK